MVDFWLKRGDHAVWLREQALAHGLSTLDLLARIAEFSSYHSRYAEDIPAAIAKIRKQLGCLQQVWPDFAITVDPISEQGWRAVLLTDELEVFEATSAEALRRLLRGTTRSQMRGHAGRRDHDHRVRLQLTSDG